MQDYPFFTAKELRCKCGECEGEMDRLFMEKYLIPLRREAGFPFIVASAYRCPQHNANVSSSGLQGPHTTGRAIDIRIRGSRALSLVSLAVKHGMTGIGVSQKGDHASRFIHLDNLSDSETDGPRPWLWSY